MPALDVSAPSPGSLDHDRVEVGIFADERAAAARGLVVLAAGEPYWLDETPAGIRLLVERAHAPRLLRQLEAFERESQRWPPPPVTDPWVPRQIDLITPLLWAALILGLFRFTSEHPQWIERGALDAHAVWIEGEFWRPATSLFLHGDAGHVISNALTGVLIFPALLATFGRWRGWSWLLATGIAGNAVVAALNLPGPYRSVGASTAIFAAVGLFTGRAVRLAWRSPPSYRWRRAFVPLGAGLIVLGLHGAGGERVDVGAHLAGFVAGFLGGLTG